MRLIRCENYAKKEWFNTEHIVIMFSLHVNEVHITSLTFTKVIVWKILLIKFLQIERNNNISGRAIWPKESCSWNSFSFFWYKFHLDQDPPLFNPIHFSHIAPYCKIKRAKYTPWVQINLNSCYSCYLVKSISSRNDAIFLFHKQNFCFQPFEWIPWHCNQNQNSSFSKKEWFCSAKEALGIRITVSFIEPLPPLLS